MRLRWVVFGAELPAPGTCLLGTRVGVVARVRLQVVEMERFGARVGQLTTRGPPFDGRLDVSGLVWDRSAAKAAEWSASLASERAMLSQIDAYVGGDGGWASGEVDPDEDDYSCTPLAGVAMVKISVPTTTSSRWRVGVSRLSLPSSSLVFHSCS